MRQLSADSSSTETLHCLLNKNLDFSYPTGARGIIAKCTMMAKPMKTYELHYPVIQFSVK